MTWLAADPLVVELEGLRYPDSDVRRMYLDEHEAWTENIAFDPNFGDFLLPFAPDRLHKANISGGMPSGVVIGEEGRVVLDSPFQEMGFLDFLNTAFRGYGFLRPDDIPVRFRKQLAEKLDGQLHYL